MVNIDLSVLLQIIHCKTPAEAVHLGLEATGAAVLIWKFLATLIPRATLWLVPVATRAAAAVAMFLLANPITGPILRANRDKIVPILRQMLELVTKVTGAFEAELEKEIAAAGTAGGASDASKVFPAADGGTKSQAGGAAAQTP